MSEQLPQGVSNILDEEAPMAVQEAQGEPIYKVDKNLRIPVSKHLGKRWKGKIDSAHQARKLMADAWDEAIRYYNHDQSSHRDSRENSSSNRYYSKRRNTQWSETENIVYANTRAMMPALYAKNPQVEFTTANEKLRPLVQQLEKIANSLAVRPAPVGLNLKVHAKQAVLAAELCNIGWLEYGYTEPPASSQAVAAEMEAVGQKLAKAKDQKEIRELEGQLLALEEISEVLTPPGPWVAYRHPRRVLVDPDSTNPDYSDARWIAVNDFYPTDYLNARYGEKDENGQYKSIYQPTHVLVGSENAQDDVDNFKLIKGEPEAAAYGYDNKQAMQNACRTSCWRIWDKTTRRVYMFAENKWEWPIWVVNDPYGLPNFFPLRAMYFNTSVVGSGARSNVTYYLDQQDAINEIHSEYRIARQNVRENILYDSRMDRDSVVEWLKGGGPNATGVKIPDGMSLRDAILEKPNVMLKAMPLFDTQRLYGSIDRISGVTDVVRGAQFKTNTTNKAIENYNSSTAMRLDEKIDAVEDAIGEVLYGVAFLCAQFMSAEDVAELLGEEAATDWQNVGAADLRNLFQAQAVGGSTQKPTSQAKKQQALEISDILGKFAQAAPTTAMTMILNLLNEAFDEVELPDGIFEKLSEEVQQMMRRGSSDAGAANTGDMPDAPGAATAPQEAEEPTIEQVAAIIDQLPPAAKQALGKVLAAGAPFAEALPEVLRLSEQAGVTQ
jgi:hypothetical protein